MGNDRSRRTRTLTQAEAELWADVMRDTISLRRHRRMARQKAIAAEQVSQEELEAEIERERGRPAEASASTAPVAIAPAIVTPSTGRAVTVLPATLDRRQTRMIATGRADIDARLDLHGMRQDEAHRALRNFLAVAQAQGARIVLIITGKGKSTTDAAEVYSSHREVGVLRRLVPMWLRELELRQAVIACGPSDARHGGAGALYVQLRRRR
jgi:DNA-nicking Smr family endonuclease